MNTYYDSMLEPILILLYYYKLFVTDKYNTVGNIFKRPPYMIKTTHLVLQTLST